MRQYLDLLHYILENGTDRQERTGIGTRSVFGYQMKMDLSEGFPLLTTKKVFMKAIIHELLWFLKGETNIQYLVQNGVNIRNERSYQIYLEKNGLTSRFERYSTDWKKKLEEFTERIKINDKFADERGELGPIYGKQWRSWETSDGTTVDQVQNVINMLKTDPSSRRIIINGRNVGEIEALIHDHNHAPPPCHTLFQFHVMDGKLSCQLYQRSADVFLGVPFNIASYALLTMMIAQVCDLKLGTFVHTFGDVHIYHNHIHQVNEQLSRSPQKLPTMKINPKVKDIFQFTYDDFELKNYSPLPSIKAPIAV